MPKTNKDTRNGSQDTLAVTVGSIKARNTPPERRIQGKARWRRNSRPTAVTRKLRELAGDLASANSEGNAIVFERLMRNTPNVRGRNQSAAGRVPASSCLDRIVAATTHATPKPTLLITSAML